MSYITLCYKFLYLFFKIQPFRKHKIGKSTSFWNVTSSERCTMAVGRTQVERNMAAW